MQLLEDTLGGEIYLNNFAQKYNQYFEYQLKVSNYGFSKLAELLKAIPEPVTIVENPNHEKVVQDKALDKQAAIL